MALSFGVTVLPDPPYQRLVELIVKAESLGFDLFAVVRDVRDVAYR